MIGGYIKNAMSHPVVAGGAGFLIGWHALSGSLFAGLLMGGTIGAALQARKMQAAEEAASQAAITTAQRCGDPNNPECVAEAKTAAIAAGQAALARHGVLPVRVAVALAFAAAFIVIWATTK
jgi:hypothetical protein